MIVDENTKIYVGDTQIISVYQGESILVGYTPLNYIQSTGAQYINTGYYANGNSQYEIGISDATKAGVVFGAYNNAWETGSGFYHNYRNTGNNLYEWFHYFSNTQLWFQGIDGYENIYMDTFHIYINGNLIQQQSSPVYNKKTFSVNYPTYLLAGNWCGIRAEQPLPCKLYYFRIKEDNVLIHDFIPVLDRNKVPCLYDKVSQTCFYNQGTGTFLYG